MRNKKVILILCLLVLVSSSVQAQRLKAVQNEKGRYGFMTEDGTVVIIYKYDEATPFKDGIDKIGKDGKAKTWQLYSGCHVLRLKKKAALIINTGMEDAGERN